MKNLLAQVPIGSTFNSPFGTSRNLGDLISLILRGSLVVAGIIVVFYFVMGGIQMIQGAGNDDPKAAAAGKQTVTAAIIGFIIVFMAYFIIQALQVILGGAGSTFITKPNIH